MGIIAQYLVPAFSALILTAALARAQTPAPEARHAVPLWHQISGDRLEYEVGDDDTSRSIAARFGEPDDIILSASGEPDAGTKIVVDNRHVIPAVLADGVVINVPQRMLFVFGDGQLAAAWPVTVGRPDWPTPLGSFYVAARQTNPTWHVPPAIQDEMEEEGIDVPDTVEPGPKNPLGKSWVGLDHGGIGIHGTNRPLSIFLFGSHGCIRLNSDDATKLLHMVSPDEPVEIIYQPVALAALKDGRIFLESDSDPYAMGRPHLDDVRETASRAGIAGAIDWQRASRVLATVEGIARRIDKGGAPDGMNGS
jgi:L,D-transpeptidase ErfK/SrfK